MQGFALIFFGWHSDHYFADFWLELEFLAMQSFLSGYLLNTLYLSGFCVVFGLLGSYGDAKASSAALDAVLLCR